MQPLSIQNVEEAIQYTLQKNAFENTEEIRELLRFMVNEKPDSNKSTVIGSSIYISNKDVFVKLLRSKSKVDVNYVTHRRIRLNKETIRYLQSHIPTPLTFKTDRLYLNRTVVDRTSTLTVATDQYVYKRIHNGVRKKDGLVVDAGKLSTKDFVALLDQMETEDPDSYKDRHGNYIGLEMSHYSSDHRLDLSIHGREGEYHSGLVVPSRLLDAAHMLFVGLDCKNE